MKRLFAWISDLRVAIGLLILIAIASGLGTLVPQKESPELYHRVYDAQPWLGCSTAMRCCGCSSTTCIPAAGFWRCWPGWGWP